MSILLKADFVNLDKQMMNLVLNWIQIVVHGHYNIKPKLNATTIDANLRLNTFREVFVKTSELLLKYLNFGGEDGFQCLDKSHIVN